MLIAFSISLCVDMCDCYRHYVWIIDTDDVGNGKGIFAGHGPPIRALERTREEYLVDHKREPRWIEVYRYWKSANFEYDTIWSVYLETRDTAVVKSSNSDHAVVTMRRVLKSTVM